MLENLYTTKMSSSKQVLQTRFAKIRSKSGRLAKIMAAVLSAVIVITIFCANFVMAAMGADGLEHWDKTEIYLRDGIDFNVNLSGREVPQWLREDIAGSSDIISVKLRNYDVRYPGGTVNYGGLAEVSGANGSYVYPCEINIGLPDGVGSTMYEQTDLNTLYHETGASYFTGLSYEKRGRGGSGHIMTSRFVADKYAADNHLEIGARDYFDVLFGFSEKNELISVGMTFYSNIPKFYHLPAELSSVRMIGGIENRITDEWKLAPSGRGFTFFEENYYQNIPTEYADISVASADIQKIILNTKLDFDGANYINAEVYKDKERIGIAREYADDTLTIDLYKAVSVGDKCRIYLFVSENNYDRIVYRWQDYVTIQ